MGGRSVSTSLSVTLLCSIDLWNCVNALHTQIITIIIKDGEIPKTEYKQKQTNLTVFQNNNTITPKGEKSII